MTPRKEFLEALASASLRAEAEGCLHTANCFRQMYLQELGLAEKAKSNLHKQPDTCTELRRDA